MAEGVPKVEKNRPEHSGGEEHGKKFTARSNIESPRGVRAVPLAEAIFECGAQAAFAGAAEMKALHRVGS